MSRSIKQYFRNTARLGAFLSMRILIISPVYPPHKHGIGDYTFFLGNSWAEKGHEVIVLTDMNCCKAEDNNKNLVKLSNHVTSWSIWNVFRIFRQVLRVKPHFISIQYESGAYHEKTAINWLPLLCKMFCQYGIFIMNDKGSIKGG